MNTNRFITMAALLSIVCCFSFGLQAWAGCPGDQVQRQGTRTCLFDEREIRAIGLMLEGQLETGSIDPQVAANLKKLIRRGPQGLIASDNGGNWQVIWEANGKPEPLSGYVLGPRELSFIDNGIKNNEFVSMYLSCLDRMKYGAMTRECLIKLSDWINSNASDAGKSILLAPLGIQVLKLTDNDTQMAQQVYKSEGATSIQMLMQAYHSMEMRKLMAVQAYIPFESSALGLDFIPSADFAFDSGKLELLWADFKNIMINKDSYSHKILHWRYTPQNGVNSKPERLSSFSQKAQMDVDEWILQANLHVLSLSHQAAVLFKGTMRREDDKVLLLQTSLEDLLREAGNRGLTCFLSRPGAAYLGFVK